MFDLSVSLMNNGNWERNRKSCTSEFHLLMFFHLIFTVSYFLLWMCSSQKLELGLTSQVFRWCSLCGKFLLMANTGDMSMRNAPAAVGMPTAEAWQWKMKALKNGRPADFLPNFVLYLIWIRFCFGFSLFCWVCWVFYHSSCKLRLPVLLSDLHKHLMKRLY